MDSPKNRFCRRGLPYGGAWHICAVAIALLLFVSSCGDDESTIESVKTATYFNGQTFAQVMSSYETEHTSVSWNIDPGFQPDNRNLVKVVGSIAVKLGSHPIDIKVSVIWNKGAKSVVAIQNHFGRLTDFGKDFMGMASLSPEEKQMAMSTLMWFTVYGMAKVAGALSTDDGVEQTIERINSTREENDKILLPW